MIRFFPKSKLGYSLNEATICDKSKRRPPSRWPQVFVVNNRVSILFVDIIPTNSWPLIYSQRTPTET